MSDLILISDNKFVDQNLAEVRTPEYTNKPQDTEHVQMEVQF